MSRSINAYVTHLEGEVDHLRHLLADRACEVAELRQQVQDKEKKLEALECELRQTLQERAAGGLSGLLGSIYRLLPRPV